jgi:CRP-like cAMP-binding protein
MSLLTGAPRAATVVAKGDCVVLEIGADAFGAWIRTRPEVVDQLAANATERRRQLDIERGQVTPAAIEPLTIAQRMRKFLRL